MDADLLVVRLDALDARRVHAQLAGELRGGDLRVDFRRDAVTQDVPARGVVTGEFEALLVRKILPDALRVRPHLVDDDGGIGAELAQPRAVLLHEREQLLEAQRGEIDAGGREVGPLDAAKMSMWQPAVARDGVDKSLPAERAQGDDGIDGGEAGAEDDDGAAGCGQPVLPRLPGIADPAGVITQVLGAGQAGRGFVAGGEEDAVDLDLVATGEVDGRAGFIGHDVERLVLDEGRLDRHGLGRRLEVLLHQAAQVIAVGGARDEALAQLDVGYGVVLAAGAEPLDKMVRDFREGGHVARRDVEQVLPSPRAVGRAASGGATGIDERDVQGTLAEAREIDGAHHAAEAAADDRDTFGMGGCHGGSGCGSAGAFTFTCRAQAHQCICFGEPCLWDVPLWGVIRCYQVLWERWESMRANNTERRSRADKCVPRRSLGTEGN